MVNQHFVIVRTMKLIFIAHNLYFAKNEEDFRWARYDTLPKVTFSYPEIGSVGLTEAEAIKAGYNVGVGKNYYSSTAKGYAMGINPGDVNDGFVKNRGRQRY